MNANQFITVILCIAILWAFVSAFDHLDDIIHKEAVKRTRNLTESLNMVKRKLAKKDKEVKVLQVKLEEAESRIKELEDK